METAIKKLQELLRLTLYSKVYPENKIKKGMPIKTHIIKPPTHLFLEPTKLAAHNVIFKSIL